MTTGLVPPIPSPPCAPASVRLVAFDLDDTLAPSKTAVDPRMAALLVELLDVVEVCVISGGNFGQFETQLVGNLPLDRPRRARRACT